jgi:hypothetical protein
MIRSLGLMACAAIALLACNSGTKTTDTDTTTTSKAYDSFNRKIDPRVPQLASDSQLTAFGRFIAGMDYPVSFHANGHNVWKNYAAGNKKNWQILDNRIGGKIRQWVRSSALEQKNEPATLFYPFAGGDFYYADLFFPNQDTIIMIGLEPGGSIFNPDTADQDTLHKYYKVLQHSMFFPHQLGFFRTKSMKNDFNNPLLNGTIHTVMFYLANAGYDIHYIRHFNVDKTGKVVNETAADKVGKRRFNAYKIGYSRGGKGLIREVIYFSQDASDGALKAQPGIMAYMNNRNQVVTFYKAASYLMHYERFSIVRDYATKRSVRILQDDSGIPFLYLKSHGFDVRLYGKFTNTLNMFKEEFQPDLKEAYETGKPDSLPFLIGYMAPRGECNLQHAVRKKN